MRINELNNTFKKMWIRIWIEMFLVCPLHFNLTFVTLNYQKEKQTEWCTRLFQISIIQIQTRVYVCQSVSVRRARVCLYMMRNFILWMWLTVYLSYIYFCLLVNSFLSHCAYPPEFGSKIALTNHQASPSNLY